MLQNVQCVIYTSVCPTMLTTLAKPLEKGDEECNHEIDREEANQ